MQGLQTVPTRVRHEGPTVKGSRFIVDIAPITAETEARAFLASVRNDFADASHHCSAWRIANPAIERSSDDGEPGGSAGRPILAQLGGRDLVDTAVIVTRFFGGTKLGVGGLMRAYGGAAAMALDSITLRPWILMVEATVEHGYSFTDTIERMTTDAQGEVCSRTFGETVVQTLRLPADALDDLISAVADVTAGAVQVRPAGA